jgi:UDP-2,4-diacetamido-2,4,6-trideoxy-beta-L-altropyranose hydrolase
MDGAEIIIRADAGPEIGTGHVMRSLALAEALVARGAAVWLAASRPVGALAERVGEVTGSAPLTVAGTPGSAEDAGLTVAMARAAGAAWIVADGYRFGARYQRAIRSSGLKLLLIDDCERPAPYLADIVLNQNLHAREAFYKRHAPDSVCLLGPRYALLRREFLEWSRWRRDTCGQARRLLVTMGGSDPCNMTPAVLRAIGLLAPRSLQVRVVIGPSNPHASAILAEAERLAVGVHLEPSPDNMAELMAWADVAISAAGSTCWELALMGLPALYVVLASNQVPIARSLERAGAGRKVGDWRAFRPERAAQLLGELLENGAARRTMAFNGRALVDGEGAGRVAAALLAMTRAQEARHARSAVC